MRCRMILQHHLKIVQLHMVYNLEGLLHCTSQLDIEKDKQMLLALVHSNPDLMVNKLLKRPMSCIVPVDMPSNLTPKMANMSHYYKNCIG